MKRLAARRAAAAAANATLLALAAGAPAAAQPLNYRLDPAHSWVHFEVLHFGTSTIRGRFGPVQGNVLLDPAAGRGEVSLAVATATVDTGMRFFDARLREADLLASAEFPQAYFVASRFTLQDGRVQALRGEFTFRGVSQPLTLTALRYACHAEGEGATREEVCGGDFEATLLRSEFGATFGLPFIANRVRLQVQVEGRRTLAP